MNTTVITIELPATVENMTAGELINAVREMRKISSVFEKQLAAVVTAECPSPGCLLPAGHKGDTHSNLTLDWVEQ